jgi:hypothetical protein
LRNDATRKQRLPERKLGNWHTHWRIHLVHFARKLLSKHKVWAHFFLALPLIFVFDIDFTKQAQVVKSGDRTCVSG